MRGGQRPYANGEGSSNQSALQLDEPPGYHRAGADTDASVANTVRRILIDYNRNHHDGDYQIAAGAKFQKG